jgi:steroid 5-alpha reductase family enzyme
VLGASAAVAVGLAIGLAGSHRGQSVGGFPLFLLLVMVAFVVQWAAFVPSFLGRTEHYFDLTGSLTYQGIAVLALVLVDRLDARTVILGLMILVWAARLGLFLFRRVRAAGGDSRFDRMKHDWAQFLMTWTIQGLWITFTAGAALAAMTSDRRVSFGVVGVIGVAVWLVGFATEALADRQKSAFRTDPANRGRFITTGLWSRSRHPNYVGEFVLWVGVALVALPALRGWQYATLVSPVFVYLLLTRISGVPMLERSADKRWGGEPDYEAYKAATPVFFPRLR